LIFFGVYRNLNCKNYPEEGKISGIIGIFLASRGCSCMGNERLCDGDLVGSAVFCEKKLNSLIFS
jgi:hypothetical protein